MSEARGPNTGRPRPLVAGNWKMNGLRRMRAELDRMMEGYEAGLRAEVDLAVFPPATLIRDFALAALGSGIRIGGQDCHAEESGAHTGDVSAEMLADAGAQAVIVGHSERRADHGESDDIVRAKAEAAIRARIVPIICVGETRVEREAGRTLDVVGEQLAGSIPPDSGPGRIVLAYEPVWAIGTGLTPSVDQIDEVHDFIRDHAVEIYGQAGHAVRLLYGGSVKPSNASEILAVENVDGALVGGASLKAADFLGIAAAYR